MNTENTLRFAKPTWAFGLFGIVVVLGLVVAIGLAVWTATQPTSPTLKADSGATKSKLGIFVQDVNSDAQKIADSGPTVLKVLIPNPNAFLKDDGEYNKIVSLVKSYKTKYPAGIVLIRFYFNEMGQPRFEPAIKPADDAAEEVYESYKPILKKMGDKGDLKFFDFIAGPTNETERVPFWSKSQLDVNWLARFWDTLTKLNSKGGIKTCAGNILTGDLPLTLENMTTLKAGLVPTLNSTGGVFCYHGYSDTGFNKDAVGQEEQALEYRRFYKALGANTPKMIIGELGIAGGWKKAGSEAQYEDWLTWYDLEIKKDAQILGAAIYEVGASGPDSINGAVASWLAQYLLNNGGGGTVTPTPTPTPTPIPSGQTHLECVAATSGGGKVKLNDNAAEIKYDGPWQYVKGGGGTSIMFQTDYHFAPAPLSSSTATKNVGANFSLTFTGDQVGVRLIQGGNRGYADVYIDGVKVDSLNMHTGGAILDTPAWQSDKLACKEHTLKVTQSDADVANHGKVVVLDYLEYSKCGGTTAFACAKVSGAGDNKDGCTAVGSTCAKTSAATAVDKCWGNPDGVGGRCYDCNGDATINILDFSCFRKNWMQTVN